MKSKISDILKLIGIYIILYIVTTAVFIALFHTPLFASMEVLMYRGTFFIVLTGLLAAVLMGVIRHFWRKDLITVKDMILLFCGCCCVNMVLFTLIPVTVERSVSVFMLSYMEENDHQTYAQEDVEDIFVEKYVKDYGAFEKRFDEQLVSGNIVENDDGTYSITEQGKQIVGMFRMVAKWFNTDQRLVYPNEN